MGSGDEYLKMTDPTALEEKVRATDPQLTSSGASLVRGWNLGTLHRSGPEACTVHGGQKRPREGATLTKVTQHIRARGQEQARPVQQTDPESRPERQGTGEGPASHSSSAQEHAGDQHTVWVHARPRPRPRAYARSRAHMHPRTWTRPAGSKPEGEGAASTKNFWAGELEGERDGKRRHCFSTRPFPLPSALARHPGLPWRLPRKLWKHRCNEVT